MEHRRFFSALLAALLGVACVIGALGESQAILHWDEEKTVTTKRVLAEIAEHPGLSKLVFGKPAVKREVIDAVREAYPELELEYTFSLCGKGVRSTAERTVLFPKTFKKFDDFLKALTYLPNLRELTAFHIAFTFDQLETLKERFPSLHMSCRVYLGGPSVRTTATAFSTKHSYHSTRYNEHDFRALKYVDNLLALDIGHNAVQNLDFLTDLPNLRILILADNQISDISPIAQLKDLVYLELFKNPIEDISPLAGLTNLIDLNMTFCKISDATPLLGLSKLNRLFLTENPLSQEQQDMLLENFPGCKIDFTSNDAPTAGGWRQGHPRYLEIVKIFNSGRYKEFKGQ